MAKTFNPRSVGVWFPRIVKIELRPFTKYFKGFGKVEAVRKTFGPQTSRKSQMPHAPGRGAAGRNPAAIARSITASTSGPRPRASADMATTRSEKPPARVQ